jgi:hypothetical protein
MECSWERSEIAARLLSPEWKSNNIADGVAADILKISASEISEFVSDGTISS